MKKVFLLMMVVSIAFFAKAQQTANPKDITKTLEFKNAEYDFGKIPYGKETKYVLEIKNISTDSVTLENVQVGCGCTTPVYEKGKRIAPNETVGVTLGFNGSTSGSFTKFVTLFFSDGMSKQVSFKGETFTTPVNSAPVNVTVEKMKKPVSQ
ncbi:MAG: DUF1573 domain-containing protein [Chitinophagaceae bacterium]